MPSTPASRQTCVASRTLGVSPPRALRRVAILFKLTLRRTTGVVYREETERASTRDSRKAQRLPQRIRAAEHHFHRAEAQDVSGLHLGELANCDVGRIRTRSVLASGVRHAPAALR